MCNCNNHNLLFDVTKEYSAFKNNLIVLAHGNWVLLMECPECKQLWKVDEWDKYQTLYAVKLPSKEDWEEYDNQSLIEERIVKNRGGFEKASCMMAKCNNNQVKGSAFCANHMYESGARD